MWKGQKMIIKVCSKTKVAAIFLTVSLFLCNGCGASMSGGGTKSIVWDIDNSESIGGHKTTVLGQPKTILADAAKAIWFDGIDDGLIVEALPLAEAQQFTLEIIFRPDANGPREQRFLHLQQDDTDYRILIETRLTDDGKWYLDTYVKGKKGEKTLYDKLKTHPLDVWYNATLVCDGQEMRHYVNGVMEISKGLEFVPPGKGRTSIGVRMNRVYWFKGAVRKIRFTPRVLQPPEFLRP
jgi:hypothetical protein